MPRPVKSITKPSPVVPQSHGCFNYDFGLPALSSLALCNLLSTHHARLSLMTKQRTLEVSAGLGDEVGNLANLGRQRAPLGGEL